MKAITERHVLSSAVLALGSALTGDNPSVLWSCEQMEHNEETGMKTRQQLGFLVIADNRALDDLLVAYEQNHWDRHADAELI